MDTRWLAVIMLVASTAIGDVSEYKLDLVNPRHVIDLPRQLPLPTRIDIYVTGPGKYIDKADTPWSLERRVPDRMLTNETEIEGLISVLQVNDNQDRITNTTKRQGYTFHLLLFQADDKTVMHFRVFMTTEFVTPWCMVDPRNDTGFCYFNDKIGSWLSMNVTNLPPDIRINTGRKRVGS